MKKNLISFIISPQHTFRKNTEAIKSLYDTNISRCDCGIRFHDSDKYKNHLSWHFKNKKNKSSVKTIYKSFFLMANVKNFFFFFFFIFLLLLKDWVNGGSLSDTDNFTNESKKVTEEQAQEEIFLLIDEAENLEHKCYLCTDKFVENWKSSKESWVLNDCIKRDGKLFHSSCYQEHQKNQSDNSEHVKFIHFLLFNPFFSIFFSFSPFFFFIFCFSAKNKKNSSFFSISFFSLIPSLFILFGFPNLLNSFSIKKKKN